MIYDVSITTLARGTSDTWERVQIKDVEAGSPEQAITLAIQSLIILGREVRTSGAIASGRGGACATVKDDERVE